MKQKLLILLFLLAAPLFSQNKNQTIGFKENKGQIIDQNGKPNTDVKYLLNSGGLNVQLKKNGFSYDIYEVKKTPIIRSSTAKIFPKKDPKEKEAFNQEYVFHRVDIDFVNSNSKVELVSEQESSDFDNYYNVPNKPEGILGVHQYKQVTYKNIYPNIDVVFTIPEDPQKTVEYNFVIHPKGKISDIQLKFNGAETNLVDNKIQMNVRFGKMEETLPASWIEEKGHKKEIIVGYHKLKKNVYGFRSANFLVGKTIVIDPTPVRLWGTYYGGSNYEGTAKSLNVDNLGYVYITGETYSQDNIATAGSFQFSTPAPASSFIAKLDSNGLRVWGTYLINGILNTAGYTQITDAVLNSKNELYIVGYTADAATLRPSVLTTPNAHQESGIGSSYEGLLMKFNSNGQRIWGTFYGGERDDQIRTVSLDSQENIIIAGLTRSPTGIATPDAFQESPSFIQYGNNGFFAKFTPSGKRIFGSYFPREINNSTVDSNDNLIFSGQYQITDYYPDISTPGAHQTINYNQDGFIVKFTSTGSRLWCTYYGGNAPNVSVSAYSDVITGIGCDNQNNIYITGYTNSTFNISTHGAFKEILPNGDVDTFLAKFNSNGTRLWGTYYGDTYTLGETAVNNFVTNEGSIYIIGETQSPNNIVTPDAYQESIINYSQDLFVSKFNNTGNLVWGTYYGGSGQDHAGNIFYKNNFLYISGHTNSSDRMSTPGTNKLNVQNADLFVAKFLDCESYFLSSNLPVCVGNTLELKASGGNSFSWTGPNGFTSTEQNPTIFNTTALNSGEYICSITGIGGCSEVKKISIFITNTNTPTGNANQSFCTGQNATIANIEITGTAIKWYDAPANGTLLADNATLQNGKTYYASQTVNSCEGPRFGVTVSIVNTPSAPTGSPEQSFCKKENKTLDDMEINGQNIKWFDTYFSASVLPNTTLLENNRTYYVSQTIGCESDRIPILVHVYDTPLPAGNNKQQFCIDEIVTIEKLGITGNSLKWYSSSTNGNTLKDSDLLGTGTYYVSQTLNNCESERLAITVKIQDTQNPVANSPQQFCIQKNAKISDVIIDGQNIKWYESSSSTNNISQSTLLENGITYYASQTINNCESDRIPVTIHILEATTGDCINLVNELPYPKFFTPNDDGFNDTWTIDPAYLAPNSSIRIFDRYGKLIKELPLNTSWNGTYVGNQLPASDYWFTVTRINGAAYQGHFSLKR